MAAIKLNPVTGKKTYKSFTPTRQIKEWDEKRKQARAQAAFRGYLRSQAKGSEVELVKPPELPEVDPSSLPPPPEKLAPQDVKALWKKVTREERVRLHPRVAPNKHAPVHPFRLGDQPYRVGGSEQKVKNPVSAPLPDAMVRWMNEKRVRIRKIDEWRWVDGKLPGQINGLPTSRGYMMMANGIYALIEREDGSVFWGHECHWVEDEDPNKPKSGGGDKLAAAREARNKKCREIGAALLAKLMAE